MLPICKAFVCLPFYKRLFHSPLQSSWGGTRPLSVSSSSRLSFIQTFNILLSTSRQQRPGCQQYGNQRFHNSMDLQPMTTRPCRHSTLSFKNGASFCMLSFSQLSYAYVFVKWKKCKILPSFLLIHIVESTIHHSLMRMDSRQRIVSNACKSLIS